MRHFYLSPRSDQIESEKGYSLGEKEALKGRKAERRGRRARETTGVPRSEAKQRVRAHQLSVWFGYG